MKATGIIRRMDDLGRVVIPREIRRAQHIKDGDPIEIFTSDGGIFLKKYSVIPSIQKMMNELKEEVSGSNLKYRMALNNKIVEMEAILKREQDNPDTSSDE